MLPGVFASASSDLRGQQVHDRPVFIRGPHRTVTAQKARSRTLFSPETARAVNQSRNKPFEANRNFIQLASELLDDPVNHAAAHQRLSHGDILMPLRPVSQQILNCYCEVMIWIHQTG